MGSEAIALEAFFGEAAAKHWRAVVEAAHAFAHATGCPAGGDVFDWFENKSADYRAAVMAHVKGSSPLPAPGGE